MENYITGHLPRFSTGCFVYIILVYDYYATGGREATGSLKYVRNVALQQHTCARPLVPIYAFANHTPRGAKFYMLCNKRRNDAFQQKRGERGGIPRVDGQKIIGLPAACRARAE